MNLPSGNHVLSPPRFLLSEGDSKVVTVPPARSEAISASSDSYEIRLPSGRKCTQQTCPLGKIRCAWVPSDDISHVSSPGSHFLPPKFVPKAMVEPSRDTSHAYALSRSFRGEPPSTETTHELVAGENHSSPLTGTGWEWTRNLLPSGNQAPTSQTTSTVLNSAG